MKFLIDTNIFIPIEIVTEADVEPNTPRVALLSKNVHELGNHVYVHPAQLVDIKKDSDNHRKFIREHKFKTYPSLIDPPKIKPNLNKVLGNPTIESNDWVDNQLVAAVHYNAVDFLVSEDNGVLNKAQKLGIRDRIINLDEALEMVDNLFDKNITPPPAVQRIRAYNLNPRDQIFEGLRNDYPDFDDWLEKCMKEDRPTFVVNHPDKENYAAISILKKEINNEFGLKGKVYKVCTFKVVNHGIKLGELMLKTIFDYATNNNADYLYVEVFPKFEHLINLFDTFGFFDLERNKYNGELRLVKKINPTDQKDWDLVPFEFHVRFGPNKIKTEGVDFFIIPIQPAYHKLLFPEFESQSDLFPGKYSYGNSLRKAYLSNANTRQIHTGDVLLFYRSEDYKSITTIGVAESVIVSKNADEIARFVGRRTVYSIDEIESLCKHGEVLSILFRQVKVLKNHYTLEALKSNKILNGSPQSITKIDKKIKTWIENRLKT